MSNQWQQTGGRRGGEKAIMWLCILLGVALAAAVAVIAVRHWLPKPGADDEQIEKTVVTAAPVKAVTILDAEDPTTVLEMEPGERRTLQASLEPADASATIRWSSGDESIATVDSSGTVSCVSPGRVVITAAVGDLTAQVMIEVAEQQKKIEGGGGGDPTPEPQGSTPYDTILGAHFLLPEGFYELPQLAADGSAFQFFNQHNMMRFWVYEETVAAHEGGDSARACIAYDYETVEFGETVTYNSRKDNKWVVSGYQDDGETIFYSCEIASDDDQVIYMISFQYPALFAEQCNPIVGTFMNSFTYDR